MGDSIQTSHTLIARLSKPQADEAAWHEFVARYSHVLRAWCARWSLQAADVDDVVQNILLELSRHIRNYRHQPPSRFRSWLKTVAHRALYDYAARRKRHAVATGDEAIAALLQSTEARDGLADQFDEECRREIIELAMQRVQGRVDATTWQAFHLMTFDGLTGEQVAVKLGIKVGTVFVARSRVRRLVQEQCQKIESVEESA